MNGLLLLLLLCHCGGNNCGEKHCCKHKCNRNDCRRDDCRRDDCRRDDCSQRSYNVNNCAEHFERRCEKDDCASENSEKCNYERMVPPSWHEHRDCD